MLFRSVSQSRYFAWSLLKTAAKWFWENVLQPLWTRIKAVWQKHIQPFLQSWWERIKRNWNALKLAGKWFWSNVLEPVWERVKNVWQKHIQPFIATWWERVKSNWNALKQAGKWIWDNMLNPVWTRVKDVWVKVKGNLQSWWDGVKKAWNKLKDAGKWIWDNMMKPVYDKVTEGWKKIRSWLSDNKDILLGPMKKIVNGVITAVNAIIWGLNKVSDILPGVEWSIDPIEKLAAGGDIPGRSARRGFKTSGARAIVGEGKANYPEFVIPTDPTYRNRARTLFLMAASKIGGRIS